MAPFNTHSDEELVKLVQAGRQEAFTALYERYLPVVFRRIRYLIPETDVEDVTQEVFIDVIRSLPRFRGESLFRTWLQTLVKREIADYYRQRGRKNQQEALSLDDQQYEQQVSKLAAPQNPVDSDQRILLQQALHELPEHYQDVLLLRFAEDLQFNQISEQMNLSFEATKSLFRRATAALAQQMGTHHD